MVHFYTEGDRSGRAEEMDTRTSGPHSQMRAKVAFVRRFFIPAGIQYILIRYITDRGTSSLSTPNVTWRES